MGGGDYGGSSVQERDVPNFHHHRTDDGVGACECQPLGVGLDCRGCWALGGDGHS